MIEPSVGVNPVMPGWPGFVSATPYGLLSLVTAPATECLTLAEAKAHVTVDDALGDDDDYLTALIQVVREWAEQETERAFITQTWTLFRDSFPWWRAPIQLPKPPTQSVTSVKYYDADNVLQTWDSSNYIVVKPAGPAAQRAQIVPAAGVSWPLLPSSALTQRRPDAVQVTFSCGYGASGAAVPMPILAAQKLMLGHLYANREAVKQGTSPLPLGVDALLAPYRVLVY